ncbi:hypothetical protein CVT26_003217 [Gymnopilus dilepis]|uniref:Mannosyltransferase n=1 Tax=Gymnopilus dilepis TaxID=231916 RepID=A0A409Y5D1_9AGAR|nr:hypothetical protein CVT26_003217 [Gymnopilus dilepis]
MSPAISSIPLDIVPKTGPRVSFELRFAVWCMTRILIQVNRSSDLRCIGHCLEFFQPKSVRYHSECQRELTDNSIFCDVKDIYFLAFPNDPLRNKFFVYGVYVLELVQTGIVAVTFFRAFGTGFGDYAFLDQIGPSWFSIPILSGLVAFLADIFYAYRISVLAESYWVAGSVVFLAITQLAGSIAQGVEMQQVGLFSGLLGTQFKVATAFWNGGSALCDVIIAVCMAFYLTRRGSELGMPSTQRLLRRVVTLIIGSGAATASIAILNFDVSDSDLDTMSIALDALIFATAWGHVLLAPYTKVEESFNLHATHDVLMYGVGRDNLHKYDHFTFPGAVPRTFIGSILLAWLSRPAIQVAALMGLYRDKSDLQIIVRLVLATLNALTLALIRRGASRRFGRTTGLFFTLLTCSQFHLPFWMGRTIPNMFATIPVNLVTYLLIDHAPNATRPSERKLTWAVALLTSTAAIIRAEVALLLAPLALQLLYSRQLPFSKLLKVGILSGIISAGMSILVDSYFWQQWPIWPEFTGIYFNVVQGKSSEWGVSPWHTYIASYLPKLLLASLPLSFIGLITDQRRIIPLLFPPACFVALISNLGHKEWRFVVYVVPLFNVAAARGARWMVSRRKNALLGRLAFLVACGLVVLNVAFTSLSTIASMKNYPGGEALLTFHQLYSESDISPAPHVHISNLAAQTGASLFLQLNSPPYYRVPGNPHSGYVTAEDWRYNKTENIPLAALSSSDNAFTHLISESPPSQLDGNIWKSVKTIKGFDRWSIDWELLLRGSKGGEKLDLMKRLNLRQILRLVESEKLWILERDEVTS